MKRVLFALNSSYVSYNEQKIREKMLKIGVN